MVTFGRAFLVMNHMSDGVAPASINEASKAGWVSDTVRGTPAMMSWGWDGGVITRIIYFHKITLTLPHPVLLY